MMRLIHGFRLLTVSVVMILAACRTSGSDVKGACCSKGSDVQNDAEAWLFREVYADGIEQVLTPSPVKSDISRNLAGLFYCQGACDVGLKSSTVMGLTVVNATVDGNALVFELLAPGNYMYRKNPLFPQLDAGYTDFAAVNMANRGRYRVEFSSREHANILLSYLGADGSVTAVDTNTYEYTMDLNPQNPHEWIRKTRTRANASLPWTDQPSYRFVKIAEPDGTRTAEYETVYKAALALSGLEKVSVVVSSKSELGKRGSQIPPKGGQLSAASDPTADSPDAAKAAADDKTPGASDSHRGPATDTGGKR